ncbi:MAG: GvpL/GvpF family gas vesicle protein [Gemmatimonadaceae bacterium]
MALRVYGVIMQDGNGKPTLPEGVKFHPLRELSAVAEEGDFSAHRAEPGDVGRHVEVINAVFEQESVLPAPVGTVFRNAEGLQAWMDLHYVALSDALAWVEDRVGARVHMTRAQGDAASREAGVDLAAVAADASRSLRRHAVSTVPLRTEELTGIVLSAACLVERELWPEFVNAVEKERARHEQLRIEVTGPWPPYDFVRMQFGS